VTLREALARSANTATVHLADEIGLDAVSGFARRLGIRSPLPADLSLALGTSPVRPIELTGAYAALASQGDTRPPHLVRRVLDRRGRVLLQAPEADPGGERIAPEVAFVTGDLLRGAVTDRGATGARARRIPHFVAGKTGTTSGHRDAWFVGFSPEIAAGVWVGYDHTRLLGRRESGSRTALPIWVEFMERALEIRPPGDREIPEQVVVRRVDADTGFAADLTSRRTYHQAFVRGTGPRRVARNTAREAELWKQLRFGM
jgi:penicillin-binding protein 1A